MNKSNKKKVVWLKSFRGGCLFLTNNQGQEGLAEVKVAIGKTTLGTGGVQGQVKGQRLMGIKAVNDSIGLATCQSKIYEK